jgi:two-component system NtrC family sensor kinase
MKKAPTPLNERERLKALSEYEILDTRPEQCYNDIVLLASSICEAPIAVVSFVDGHRQWFKARLGIEITETPREISLCGYVVFQSELVEVPDTLNDARFYDNPLVIGDPKIRFYAGAPLVNPEGYVLGTLCVLSYEPKQLSHEQKNALTALARQVVAQLELRKTNKILQKKIEQIEFQQEKLFYSAKMVSLGEMAAGISHEINNPLAIIACRISQLKDSLENNEKIDPMTLSNNLNSMERTTYRIARIIKGLRTFSRQGTNDPFQAVTLESLIEDVLALSNERFKNAGIQLEVDPENLHLKVECRPVELGQVLINLLSNSFDAVKNCEEKLVSIKVHDRGESIAITVSDTGYGIPNDVRSKLMQPFFTTKPVGQGTGLGLSISRGIIESHKGSLELDSNSPQTTFRITLPKAQAKKIQNVA